MHNKKTKEKVMSSQAAAVSNEIHVTFELFWAIRCKVISHMVEFFAFQARTTSASQIFDRWRNSLEKLLFSASIPWEHQPRNSAITKSTRNVFHSTQTWFMPNESTELPLVVYTKNQILWVCETNNRVILSSVPLHWVTHFCSDFSSDTRHYRIPQRFLWKRVILPLIMALTPYPLALRLGLTAKLRHFVSSLFKTNHVHDNRWRWPQLLKNMDFSID